MINDKEDINLREVHTGDKVVRVGILSDKGDILLKVGRVSSMYEDKRDKIMSMSVTWKNTKYTENVFSYELTYKENSDELYCIQKEEVNDEIIVKMIKSLYSSKANIAMEQSRVYSKLNNKAQEIYDAYKKTEVYGQVKELIKDLDKEEVRKLLLSEYFCAKNVK